MAKPTRKEHYVPQFYLNGFIGHDGHLFAAKKGKGAHIGEVFVTTPEDACCQRDLYEVKSRNGSTDGFVERNLLENEFQRLEDYLAPALKNVIQLTLRPRHLSDQELVDTYATVMQLLINLVTRHPELLNPFREFASTAAAMPEARRIFDQHVDTEMSRSGYSHEIEAAIELAIENLVAFSSAKEAPRGFLNTALKDSSLILVRSSVGMQFTTSSAPFAFSWRSDGDRYPELAYMPLSKETAAIFLADGTRRLSFKRLSASEVALWNRILLTGNPVWDTALAGNKGMLETTVREYGSASLPQCRSAISNAAL